MSLHFSRRRRLHRKGCVVGLLIGALGGVWMAAVAPARETGMPCADAPDRCEQTLLSSSSIPVEFKGSYLEAVFLLLLGGGVGSLAGLAIAPWIQRHSAPLASRSSSPLPPSASLDLSQFTSSETPLTRHQRETLQCLWLMAAIVPPLPNGSSHDVPSSPPAQPTSSTWEWCIRQIQQSAIAQDDLTHILTQMGFSNQTVQTAWRIADVVQSEATRLD